MTIGVRPVHPSIGAEILNVDTSSRLSQQTIDQIHTAIDKHAVVFFRNQKLTDD